MPWVLSEAVLQSQRNLIQTVGEVVAKLRQVQQALVQMNQTLSALLDSMSKLVNFLSPDCVKIIIFLPISKAKWQQRGYK